MAYPSLDVSKRVWTCARCTANNTIHTYPHCTVCFDSYENLLNLSCLTSTKTGSTIITTPKTSICIDLLTWDLKTMKSAPVDQSLPQLENAARETVRRIIGHCHEFRTHFVDDQFPPIERSLGDRSSSSNYRWLRVSEINPSFEIDRSRPWTVFSSPEPSDIQQGALGNCWLVAALALIAEHPKLLQHILLTKEVNKEGVYLVRICHNGLWETVIVDDSFPCTVDRQLAFTQAKRRQLYAPLIEKACAKIFGSYEQLKSGTLMEGLQLLTGAPCDFLNLQPSTHDGDSDIVWAKLLSACESRLLIGASSGVTTISSTEYTLVGIPDNHAFSILAAYQIPWDQSRYVLVRDPHALSVYQESSLNRDKLELLKSIHPANRWSGAFWISWSSFLRYFSSITISSYRSDDFDVRETGQFTESAIDPVQMFQFELTQHSTIQISLIYHRTDRSKSHDQIQSFVLCDLERSPSSKKYIVGRHETICISRRGGFTKWQGNLKPGTYVLIPFSFTFWYNPIGPRDYTVVIHSKRELQLEVKRTPATFLTDCLIASLLKYHDQKVHHHQSTLYFKSNPCEVCLLMFENFSSTQYLSVNVDFNSGENGLLHSRYACQIRDSIPPLHRQIIFAAEWKNDQDDSKYLDYRLSIEYRSNRSESSPQINSIYGDFHSARPL